MRLSCSTRCVPDYSFHQALKAISEAGFRYLETFTYDTGAALDPTVVHSVRIKETFAHYRLGLSSLNITPVEPTEVPPEGEKADLSYRREVLMARDLWLDRVNVLTGPPERCSREAVVGVLRQIADFAVGLGVSLAIANAPGTHVVRPEDAESLIAEVGRPNLGVLFDAARFHLAGVDVLRALERLASRILVVRIGDVAAGRWVPPGSGELDARRLIGKLHEVDYDGFVVLEMRVAARAEVEGLMREACRTLEPLLREPPIPPLVSRREGGEGAST